MAAPPLRFQCPFDVGVNLMCYLQYQYCKICLIRHALGEKYTIHMIQKHNTKTIDKHSKESVNKRRITQ